MSASKRRCLPTLCRLNILQLLKGLLIGEPFVLEDSMADSWRPHSPESILHDKMGNEDTVMAELESYHSRDNVRIQSEMDTLSR